MSNIEHDHREQEGHDIVWFLGYTMGYSVAGGRGVSEDSLILAKELTENNPHALDTLIAAYGQGQVDARERSSGDGSSG